MYEKLYVCMSMSTIETHVLNGLILRRCFKNRNTSNENIIVSKCVIFKYIIIYNFVLENVFLKTTVILLCRRQLSLQSRMRMSQQRILNRIVLLTTNNMVLEGAMRTVPTVSNLKSVGSSLNPHASVWHISLHKL